MARNHPKKDKYGNLGATYTSYLPRPLRPVPGRSYTFPGPDPTRSARPQSHPGSPSSADIHTHRLNNPGPKSRTVCSPWAASAMPTGVHASGGGTDGGGTDRTHAGTHAGGLGGRHSARASVWERRASGRDPSATHRMGRNRAQIRGFPAAAHVCDLVEVAVHVGAPCPHVCNQPAAAGAGRSATADVQRSSSKSACVGMGQSQGWVHAHRIPKSRTFSR